MLRPSNRVEEANLGEAQAAATVAVGERVGLPGLNLHACEATLRSDRSMEIDSKIGGGGNDYYPRTSTWLRLGKCFTRRRLSGEKMGGVDWG